MSDTTDAAPPAEAEPPPSEVTPAPTERTSAAETVPRPPPAPPSTGATPSSAEATPSRTTEAASPYLGLRSFSESDSELFHGREVETDELFHLVQRETLSVVFGMSGLGKSSLLRAGLFPRLREQGLFPIAIRLTYGASDLVAQIRAAIATEITERGIDAPPPPDDQTLWEYFHRTPFWSARNRPLTPVIVLDQFEELFTLGHDARGRSALLTELGDLIENRIPETVRRAGDADALPPTFQAPKAKMILSLREDYLARLEDLRPTIPSIARGRLRLRPMDGDQAVRAVRNASTEHLVDAAVAVRIVRFVAGARSDAADAAAVETLTVEPALLSLVCRQLDEVRRSRKEPTISADLLTGESARILDDFHERSIADLDPRIVDHIEEHLLTPDGHRTTVAVSSLESIPGVAPAVTTLIDRRLLRIEERLGRPHVEVIHDVLTRVMIARRDRRRSQRERRRRSRRRIAILTALSALAALAVGTVLYLGARQRLADQAEQQRTAVAAERRTNAQRSAKTLAAEASTLLSRGEVWSAARMLEVAHGITGADSPPELTMLVGRITALDRMLAAVLSPGSGTTAIAFSGDGTQLFVGHRDGSASIWSTADWTERRLVRDPGVVPPNAGSASATRDDPTVPARDPPHAADVLAISHDGQYAAITAGDEITVWNTRTQAVLGAISGFSLAGPAVHVSDDAHWILRVGSRYAALLHLQRGSYVEWSPPEVSDRCVAAATHDKPYDPDSIGLAISGDGSTLAVYRRTGSGPGTRREGSELSVFRLKDDGPELLAARCEPNRRGVAPRVNFDGTWFGLQASDCASETDGCASTSIVYRLAAPRQLEVVPGLIASTFDARRPELMLGRAAAERAIMTLDGRLRRSTPAPCNSGVQADLVDGRLAMIGSCGRFTLVDADGPTMTGELPVAGKTEIRISAAAALAVTASSDGVVRVWRLRSSPDHVVHAPSRPGPGSPRASIRPFAVGPPSRDGALVVSRDGRQVIAGAIDRQDLAPRVPVAAATPATPAPTTRQTVPRRILGIFEITSAAIRPFGAVMEHLLDPEGEHGVTHVELSPDEQRILSVGSDRRVRVWNRAGAQVLDLGNAATEPVRYARYSPDGQRIATLENDRTCLWNASNGRRLDCIASGAGRTVAFDRAGAVIVADKDGGVTRWDPATHTTAVIGHHTDRIERIDVDRAGRRVASAGIDALRVWDLERCSAAGCQEVAHAEDLRGFERAEFVAVSDQVFVLGIVQADRAHVIDLAHPDVDRVLSLAADAQDVDISTDGRALLCESNGTVEEWDLARQRLTGRIQIAVTDSLFTANSVFGWCAARYLGDGIITQFSDGSLATWPGGALAAGIASSEASCIGTAELRCSARDVMKVFYADASHVVAYDGDLVRLLSASGELLAAARSVPWPVAADDGAAFLSPAGQLGVLHPSGQLEWVPHASRRTPMKLARDRGSGESLWIDSNLRYRLVDRELHRGADRQLASNRGHGRIQAIALAPLGRWMVAAYEDDTLTRFDTDGRPVRSLRLSGGASTIVPATHGDGLLAVGGSAVEAWSGDDVSTEVKAASGLSGRAAAWDVAANAIVLGTHKGLERLDLPAGRPRWRSYAPRSALFTMTWVDLDGRQPTSAIITAALDHMSLVALDDGRTLRELPDRAIDPQTLAGTWFIEPDLLLTRTAHRDIELWNLGTGRRMATEQGFEEIAIGPPGRFATQSDGHVAILRIRDPQLVKERELRCGDTELSWSTMIAWSADFRWIAAADKRICLWDAATGALAASWASPLDRITGLSFSHDGSRLLASGWGGPPRLWEVPTGKLVSELEEETLLDAVFVHGQPYLVTEDQSSTVRTYDARSGKQVAESRGIADLIGHHVDEISGRLAFVDRRGGGAVIDVATGDHLLDLPPNGKVASALAVAPGGRAVGIASEDEVRLWSLSPVASPAVELDASHLAAMAFSPDGAWLATAAEVHDDSGKLEALGTGLLTIWKISDGTPILALPTDAGLTAVSWSDDGSHLVVGGRNGFVKTFDVSRETRDHGAIVGILKRIVPSTSRQAVSPSIRSTTPSAR